MKDEYELEGKPRRKNPYMTSQRERATSPEGDEPIAAQRRRAEEIFRDSYYPYDAHIGMSSIDLDKLKKNIEKALVEEFQRGVIHQQSVAELNEKTVAHNERQRAARIAEDWVHCEEKCEHCIESGKQLAKRIKGDE